MKTLITIAMTAAIPAILFIVTISKVAEIAVMAVN